MNENSRRAVDKLRSLNLWYRIIELGARAISAKDVERLSDVNPKEIFKTLIITDGKSFYAVMIPGDSRLDLAKAEKALGARGLRLAKAKEIKSLGYEPGTVCPLLLDLPTVIDPELFKHEKINFGSGDLYYGIEMFSRDILKCVQAKIEDVKES